MNLLGRQFGGSRLGSFSKPNVPSVSLINLVEHWKLNEGNFNAPGAHSTIQLTKTGTCASAAGKIGTSRNMSNIQGVTNNFLDATDTPELASGTGGNDNTFTMCCWFYLTSKLVNIGLCGEVDGFGVWYDATADRMKFVLSEVPLTVTADNFGSPSIETWYFLIIEQDIVNNILTISINNGTRNTVVLSSPVQLAGLMVGKAQIEGSLLTWDGRVDSFSYFLRLLTTAEKALLYNADTGLDYPFGN